MNKEASKALRNLQIGGVYTTIVFGILFIIIPPLTKVIDPSGGLAGEMNLLGADNSSVTGGSLLFFGLNTYIYFRRYVKVLELEC